MPGREDLHRYTRCRFVWDEAREMAKRHVSFDVEALANTAADAMGSSHCDSILKLLDSNYSKTLLLTMDDGVQVVAKIPNPNAGRPHLTIASEVATMDFVSLSRPLVIRQTVADITRRATCWNCRCQRFMLGVRMPRARLSEPSTSSWRRREVCCWRPYYHR